jgi:hypothetical protein
MISTRRLLAAENYQKRPNTCTQMSLHVKQKTTQDENRYTITSERLQSLMTPHV